MMKTRRTWRSFTSSLCFIAMLAATAAAFGESLPETRAPAAREYLIGPGDVLGIEVWKDPGLTRTVVVLPDGRIVFPLIGEFPAAGKTVETLKSEIAERLKLYVPDTVLTLEVKQVGSLFVYVLGRINNPGRLQLSSNVTVLQALATAGGLNPYAKHGQIKVFRQEGTQTKVLNFDYDDVTSGARMTDNIELMRGDVIFVP